MENPNKIEIEGLKTIHKLCNFGAEHDMEGCSFTEIVERMFSKIKSMQTQVNTLDEMLLNQGDALAEAKAQAVPEGFVLVEKTKLMQIVGSAAIIEPITRGNPLMSKYKTELDFILSTVRAMIKAQEPAPLKLGDLVKPIDHRYTLASGCERYPYAYVVNTNPFQLMSEEGDMYWCCTVEAGGYKLIKSNDQLPEAVSLRMIREGLLAPVETQEQSHD